MLGSRRLALAALASALVVGCGNKDKSSSSSCPAPTGTTWDTDGDLLTNAEEARLGTDPADPDSDGDGFGDYVECMAETDPLADASAPSGQVARLKLVETAADLVGGPGAIGAVGDWMLENDRLRAIVQRVDAEQMQVGTYGGNLVDADVLRAPGEEGNDTLGMVIPLFSFQQTFRPSKAVVVNDGSDGGAAVLRVCGKDDTYEYLDLVATFELFGLGLRYEQNPDFDMDVSTEYTLAPGADRVEVVTTLHNHGKRVRTTLGDVVESGAAQEIFNTNNQGFGQLSFGDILDAQPPMKYMGFLSPGSSWGYVLDSDPNVAVTVSGVTVTLPEFATTFEAAGSDPDSEGDPIPGQYDVGKGKRVSFRRSLVVTDGANGLAESAAAYFAKRDVTPVTATGTVTDGGGPLAGARVALLVKSTDPALDRVPIAVTISAADGTYSFTAAPGEYYVVADVEGRLSPAYSQGATTITTRQFGNVVDAASVTLSAASDLPDLFFDDASVASLTVVRASDSSPVPARLSVVGTDPSPADSIFRDPKERTSVAVPHHALTPDGAYDFALEPGTVWTVYASHGTEWSVDTTTLSLAAGQTTSAELVIGPVVDSSGWISADFHVHAANSPDSPVPLGNRVVNAAADGLDALVATDHDYITDFAPVAESLGLSGTVATVVGSEITTWAMGHFNMWPLTPDPSRLSDGGAYKWAGGKGAVSHHTAAEIFSDVDAAHAGTQVRQVNHPRDFALQSFYEAIQLDTLTLQTKQSPEFLRIPTPEGATEDDTRLFSRDFDAQEVYNGAQQDATLTSAYLNDLFTMLSHGITVVGTGNSDTHKVFSSQLGYPRNYVALASDAPAALAGQLEPFALAMVNGQSFFTTGPFVRVTATGADSGGPGDMVTPAAGTVTLDIDLEMPDWIDVDTVRVYVNTPGTTALFDESGNRTAPVPAHEIDIGAMIVTTSAGNGLSRKVLQDLVQPVSVSGFTTDAWIVVTVSAEATATSLFPVIPAGVDAASGTKPFALVNAIYVDVDGDQTYDPPGATAPAAAARPKPPVRRWDAAKGEINAANAGDIRAQWKRLTEGACEERGGAERRVGSAPGGRTADQARID